MAVMSRNSRSTTSPQSARPARLLAGVGLLLVVASCADPDGTATGPAGPAGEPGRGEEVVVAVASEPDTLNPVLGYARWGDGKVVEGLLALGADLRPEPLLALDLPEVSEDGLTYTYTLRDGVTFGDGSTLDAEDVVATYEAALDPDLASPVAADLTALEEVEAVDARTVRFTLRTPQSSFTVATVLGIVPSETLGGDRSAGEIDRVATGTGPYEVESYRPGEQVVLAARDDYWGEAPQVRRATFLFVPDDSARAARLAAGEVEAAQLPVQALTRFEQDPAYQVVRRDTADYRAIVLPEAGPVTSDPAVRRALHVGLDRDATVAGALAGAGRPAFGPLPEEATAYSPALEVDPGGDPEAARRVLDDAGWHEGPDGVRVRDGQRASFVLMYPAGDTLRQNLALEVQAQATGLGLEVRPEGLSWEAIEARMATDALVYGSGNPYDGDLAMYPLFHSSRAGQGFDNPGRYVSAPMDRALEEGREALDAPERDAAYARAQEQLAEDLPWVFLVYVEHDYVIRSGLWDGYDVQLVEPHEHGLQGGPWWNLQAWAVRR